MAGDETYIPIFIEEKVDGANLGFSMDPESWSIRAQNRAHLVCDSIGEQWKGLDTWLEGHSSALYKVLAAFMGINSGTGAPVAEEDFEAEEVAAASVGEVVAASDMKLPVLYGEWLKVKHSMYYDRLPGYFIAFDLWTGERFLTRAELHTALSQAYDDSSGERIPVIPILHHGPFFITSLSRGGKGSSGAKDVENFLDSQLSVFKSLAMAAPGAELEHGDKTGQHVEGIVLRRELPDGGLLKMKVVRGEFQREIVDKGHFMHQKTVVQKVDEEVKWSYPSECFTQAA